MIHHRHLSNGQLPISAGFTLVEMLVVVVVIAVLVSVTTLSLGVVEQREFRSEADRLQLALQQAADSALFQQQTHGLHIDTKAGNYWISDHKKGQWQQGSQPLFRLIQLDPKTTLSMLQPSPLRTRIEEDTEPKKQPPAIVFSSSGEYTPFQIQLEQAQRTAWVVHGDGLGKIRLRPAND
ncbi:type II secretion system minor pseudopilin GspH [Porticoccus sp. W117]|uniref:type II secretion system minor pseudopilin GspH n=1 Tax=Porticoccus sp. W117 TaxID=3054777 RepID=UPI0025938451|nr:type II secretion system minor pseudopilin GspH [Porticoccus sp. W117]MDM3872567.1 type II secretion system minor pseudopilin GspH [Porticoccus sp. W117]